MGGCLLSQKFIAARTRKGPSDVRRRIWSRFDERLVEMRAACSLILAIGLFLIAMVAMRDGAQKVMAFQFDVQMEAVEFSIRDDGTIFVIHDYDILCTF